MSSSILKSALKLSEAQRIILVEQIWDSIAEGETAPPLTVQQALEVERRLARLKRTGPLGSSWEDVKARIRKRRA